MSEIRVVTFTETELETLLIRAARLGASQFRDELQKKHVPAVMTKAELADYLNCSPATINRYMNNGMPHDKPLGGHPRFVKSDIDKWLSSKNTTASA